MQTITLPILLRRSLTHGRSRTLSALIALTVAAAVATTLLTLYASLDAKLHKEFRSFGANIIVTGPALTPKTIAQARRTAGPDALAAPFAYAIAQTDRKTPVVVVGADFPSLQKLDSWWQIQAWPSAPNAALLGQRAAEFVGDEKSVNLTYDGKPTTFTGAGRLKTGGDEDSRIYLPLPAFTAWTGVQPTVLELQIPGGAQAVEAAQKRLQTALPESTVTPVRQLVQGESNIVDRTHTLMFAALLLIAATVATSVLSTLSASVLERRRDFALMRALGSSESHLMRLFLLETGTLALAGALLGWIVGSALAALISQLNFGTSTWPSLAVLPIALAINAAIAAIAALAPIRALRSLAPATLLKGE